MSRFTPLEPQALQVALMQGVGTLLDLLWSIIRLNKNAYLFICFIYL